VSASETEAIVRVRDTEHILATVWAAVVAVVVATVAVNVTGDSEKQQQNSLR